MLGDEADVVLGEEAVVVDDLEEVETREVILMAASPTGVVEDDEDEPTEEEFLEALE